MLLYNWFFVVCTTKKNACKLNHIITSSMVKFVIISGSSSASLLRRKVSLITLIIILTFLKQIFLQITFAFFSMADVFTDTLIHYLVAITGLLLYSPFFHICNEISYYPILVIFGMLLLLNAILWIYCNGCLRWVTRSSLLL